MKEFDCIVVGASFAGLACATTLARRGARVLVLEKKEDPGEKLHTTGILVKEAVEETALLDGLPPHLVRRADGVRLYAPDLNHIDLAAPGYYFLATDTPELMRWLAWQARDAGVEIACGVPFRSAKRSASGFDLGEIGRTRTLVGADGTRSTVAAAFGLGRNRDFLFGIEHEYEGLEIPHPDRLHCFVDRRLAPGYIGWVVAGPRAVQIGLARRVKGRTGAPPDLIEAFLRKISPVIPVGDAKPASIRAGLIPCGGVVHPVAAPGVLLVGDAAGMVSPVTAGGIHTALRHGAAAGRAIDDFLRDRVPDPAGWLPASYPTFRGKLALRSLFDRLQSDTLFNLALRTRPMRAFAERIYFHRKGTLDGGAQGGSGGVHSREDEDHLTLDGRGQDEPGDAIRP